MAAFVAAADTGLGAACNRLAARAEPLPAGEVIDAAAGLTEADLALILRHLYATRLSGTESGGETRARASVPITVRD